MIPERFEKLLLPLATVITPNDFEAEVLTGVRISTLGDAVRAWPRAVRQGAGAQNRGDHEFFFV